ncbi:asparagine synthase (glutamine-hydrolyzing) (plasmid) [Halorussus limi]|uniref:Putative asparagine synthetase [glutamine-hydrolyzing] n=2 Tax=Halorussus limi TaxID=2938695 RepID=A0A8U0HZV3_9EURY|nr:asparagine synthase (glutamine-hydrolyzing) [Halorussus limi]
MADCLTHRGPDAEGIYVSDSAMLAHRRLSILDLSSAGRQPMSNADGTLHIVFNGEIYNYRELRERVSDRTFRSETDTEVLLYLYEKYGPDCLSLLRGMFAFAIWDERRERLFLARDPVGQKPLFYHRDPKTDTFVFGSTVMAILQDEAVKADPDYSAIRSYLTYQYVPNPATGFKGIRQLRPGEYAIVGKNGLSKQTYWQLSFADQFHPKPRRIADLLREQLREATRLRLRSDVPLGVFLSGGIDSSVVTAVASEVSDEAVSTYSIGFEEDAYNEQEFARTVSQRYGTDHHELTVTSGFIDILPKLVRHYEVPFGDPSMLPTYYVSQIASDYTTVALTGDGGDENFAGYDRYTWDRLATATKRTPAVVRTATDRALELAPKVNGFEKSSEYGRAVRDARRFLDATERDRIGQYATFVCHALNDELDAIWNGPAEKAELAELRTAFEASDGATRLDQLMHVDITTYLPDDLLVKVDRASMAHSMEVRSPFLDHRFIEFVARIPAHLKWRWGEKKWLLKRAFEDLLPDEIYNRSKQGFGIPVNEWFRGELRDWAAERLQRLGDRPAFDRGGLQSTFCDHQKYRTDAGYRIWDLVTLETWFEEFIDPPAGELRR